MALVTGAGRPPDPVHVVFRHMRQLEVDDVRQPFDVESSRRHIRRHQHANLAGLEIVQRPNPGCL